VRCGRRRYRRSDFRGKNVKSLLRRERKLKAVGKRQPGWWKKRKRRICRKEC